MTRNDNLRLIPIELTITEYQKLAGASNYEFRKIMIGNRLTTGILVPADDETYRGYMRMVNNELKREERDRKCWIKSPITGKPIKCTLPCYDCPRMKDGKPISIERLYEEDGQDIVDESQNTAINLLYQDCLKILERHDPLLSITFEYLYDGLSIDAIASKLKIKRNDARKLREEAMRILQEVISKEDIFSK